ncbi:hypothetical protein MRX96_009466 [Rhipicephalus microplus]
MRATCAVLVSALVGPGVPTVENAFDGAGLKPGVGFLIFWSSSREVIQRIASFVVVNPGPGDPKIPV